MFSIRERAWEFVNILQKQMKTDSGGFTVLKTDGTRNPDGSRVQDDFQPSQFLGATLKYLYLTFTDSRVMSLNEWVFNSAGQPLPVCGINPAYPKNRCVF